MLYGVLLAVVVFCFIVTPLLIYQRVPIRQQSMYPTIHGAEDGGPLEDEAGLSLLSPCRRGDIVIFEQNGKRLVKRIIGVPGDTLRLADSDPSNGDCRADEILLEREGKLYRLEEPYLNDEYGRVVANDIVRSDSNSDIARALWSEEGLYLGEGEFFVVGDNRRVSNDSFSFGPVQGESIVGKVVCIYRRSGQKFLFWDIYDIEGIGPGLNLVEIGDSL